MRFDAKVTIIETAHTTSSDDYCREGGVRPSDSTLAVTEFCRDARSERPLSNDPDDVSL